MLVGLSAVVVWFVWLCGVWGGGEAVGKRYPGGGGGGLLCIKEESRVLVYLPYIQTDMHTLHTSHGVLCVGGLGVLCCAVLLRC